MISDDARRLYGFSDAPLSQVKAALQRQRFTYSFHPVPAWAVSFGAQMVEIETLYGEYGGFIGAARDDEAPSDSSAEDAVRTKHPDWPASKVRRAAQQKAQATRGMDGLLPKVWLEMEANIAKSLCLIRELASCGPFTLILTSGAIPALGARQQLEASALNEQTLWRFPANVPVTFVERRQAGGAQKTERHDTPVVSITSPAALR